MKKGQAAIETLVILSVSLIILLVIYFSAQDRMFDTSRGVSRVQIKESMEKLSNAADFVYGQTIGASTEVYITVPAFVDEIRVMEHGFGYVMLSQGARSMPPPEVTTARLSGSIDSTPGSRWIVLKNEGDFVRVYERNED